MQTMDFLIALFFWDGKKSRVLCINNSVQKIVNDGLSKTLVRALPYGTVWDETSPFVVSGVSNRNVFRVHFFNNKIINKNTQTEMALEIRKK